MKDPGTRDENWVSVQQRLPADDKAVDLWMDITPSLRTLGVADSFCVPVSWLRNGKWYHCHDGRETELDGEYVTYWRDSPS